MTTEYDFNGPFINIDDKTSSSLAKELYYLLGTEVEGRTTKLFGWYETLKICGKLPLDEADRDELYKLIDETKRMGIVLKGQLLRILKAH